MQRKKMSKAAGLKLQFLGIEPLPDSASLVRHGLPPDGSSPTQFDMACEMARQGAQV